MTIRTQRTILAAAVALLVVGPFTARPSFADAPASQPAAAISFSKANIVVVAGLFKSGTDTSLDSGVAILQKWFTDNHVPAEFWKDWAPVLLAHKRNADIADLALKGLNGRPEPRAWAYLLPLRIDSLLALEKIPDALQAAKSYYNVTDTHHLSAALSETTRVLAKAHPEDPQIQIKFQTEQTTPTPPGEAAILHAIAIDPTLYDTGLAKWKIKSDAGAVGDGLFYATMLLLADKPADAEPLFRKLLPLCTKAADIMTAREGIAAALRAQDENNTRAAQYLATAPKPEAAPKPDKNDPLP